MSRVSSHPATRPLHPVTGKPGGHLLRDAFGFLDIFDASGRVVLNRLPFSTNDTTAGTETELQVAVAGGKYSVDLPLTIEASNYYSNAVRRAATGDLPKKLVTSLERILNDNTENIWENSWVRFERGVLCGHADRILDGDLRPDKSSSSGEKRTDVSRFIFTAADGREMVRVPVSYLVKLAMAQFMGRHKDLPFLLRSTGTRLMDHYLNDNTSPETFSFYVMPLRSSSGMVLFTFSAFGFYPLPGYGPPVLIDFIPVHAGDFARPLRGYENHQQRVFQDDVAARGEKPRL
jgi:hypothetical protein